MEAEPRYISTTQGDTQYLLMKWMDHVLGTAAYTPPANLYAFFTDSTNTEVPAGTKNYRRVLVNPWIDPSPPSLIRCNQNAFNFGVQSCAWDFTRIQCWLGLADALTGGNLLTTMGISGGLTGAPLQTPGGTGKRIQVPAQAMQYTGFPPGYDPTLQLAGLMTLPYCRKWLDHLFGIATWTVGTTQIALAASVDMHTGIITGEVSGGGYSRQARPSFAAAAPVAGSPSLEVRAESTADVSFANIGNPADSSDDPQVLLVDQAANLAILNWGTLSDYSFTDWPAVAPFTIPAGKLALTGAPGIYTAG